MGHFCIGIVFSLDFFLNRHSGRNLVAFNRQWCSVATRSLLDDMRGIGGKEGIKKGQDHGKEAGLGNRSGQSEHNT